MKVALLLMAHGSPTANANYDLMEIAARIRQRKLYHEVEVGFLECNEPSVPEAIDLCVEHGAERIIAVPYFLHTGKHVAIDIVNLLREASDRHSGIEFRLSDYLGRSQIVSEILMKRANSH